MLLKSKSQDNIDIRLQPGDFLFFRSNGAPWDVAINAVSEYTHVAVYTGNGKVIDANLFSGVSEYRLNICLDYDVFRINNLSPRECRLMIKELRKHKGSRYDIIGATSSGAIILANKLFKTNYSIPKQKDSMEHCSELATHGLRIIEPDFMKGTDAEFVMPDNLYQKSERMGFVY